MNLHPAPLILEIHLVAEFLATNLYYVLMHATYGQTLGKMVVKIKVLHVTETRIPTLREAFMREIGYVFLGAFSLFLQFQAAATGQLHSPLFKIIFWSTILWWVVEIVSMLTNSKRRAVHDFIAGTVVIRNSTDR